MIIHIIVFFTMVVCAANAEIYLEKIGSGLIYGDDFNDSVINPAIWEPFTDVTGITSVETGGELVVSGTPGVSRGNGFVGVQSLPYCNSHGLEHRPAVMAGKMRIPSALDSVKHDYGNVIQFHYCNISPDANVSIGFNNGRPCGYIYKVPQVQYNGCYYYPGSLLRNGFRLYLSYRDSLGTGFFVDGDSVVQLGSPVPVDLENKKRMELKALALQAYEYLDYRYDWACVYLNPVDYPVVFVLEKAGFPNTSCRATLAVAGRIFAGTGSDTIKIHLPENRIFPDSAVFSLYSGSDSLMGTKGIAYDGQLEGLFPGDTFRVSASDLSVRIHADGNNQAKLSVFPNPTSGHVMITTQAASDVVVRIYDVHGAQVRSFNLSAGSHSVVWDGRNGSGKAVPTGLYAIRMVLPGKTFSRSFLMLK